MANLPENPICLWRHTRVERRAVITISCRAVMKVSHGPCRHLTHRHPADWVFPKFQHFGLWRFLRHDGVGGKRLEHFVASIAYPLSAMRPTSAGVYGSTAWCLSSTANKHRQEVGHIVACWKPYRLVELCFPPSSLSARSLQGRTLVAGVDL